MLFLRSGTAAAWAEHEHIALGAAALRALDAPTATAADHDVLARLRATWAVVRESDKRLGAVLCADMLSSYGGCFGLPDLPMLAADHACSTKELYETLFEGWPHEVLHHAHIASTAVELLGTEPIDAEDKRSKRLEARRRLDMDLQSVDPRYLKRAGKNISHFALAREQRQDLAAFVRSSLRKGARTNALALYAHFHTAALKRIFSARSMSGSRAAKQVLWGILDEAYALHYLEDMFSAGHFVAPFEDSAKRLGTHDHYCSDGIDGKTWSNRHYVAHGDAFMVDEDVDAARPALVESLRGFAAALSDAAWSASDRRAIWAAATDDAFDVCEATKAPELVEADGDIRYLLPVLEHTPMPATEAPGVPSFRAEYGPFFPVGLSIDGGPQYYFGNAARPNATRASMNGQVRLALGIGVSADSVISEYQDGVFYINAVGAIGTDQRLTSSIGVGVQFRLPYTYVPGDFIVFAPMALAGSSFGLSRIASALRGDRTLFGWLSNVIHQNGSFRLQFDLGREASFVWHWEEVPMLASNASQCTKEKPCATVIDAIPVRWDVTLPVLSMRVQHTFGGRLGNDVHFRLAARLGHTMGQRAAMTVNGTTYDYSGTFVGGVLVLTNSARFYF
ncbi:Hypothetical protein A7982_06681 [Minicystis rosea]|nr:Hypothetical protein A7982_06681 [Minicystis rosea]